MPPRLRLPGRQSRDILTRYHNLSLIQCRYASVVTATTSAPSIHESIDVVSPIRRYPPTQPPSHKLPDVRKSQLHRQYTSLLRATPLILVFQHNNLKSGEWNGIRRELAFALQKVDEAEGTAYADYIKLQIIQTGMFASALRVVEFFNPSEQKEPTTHHPTDPRSNTSAIIPNTENLTHGLSKAAHRAARKNMKIKSGLEPLLAGPLCVLTLPAVSPAHLKAALSILSPSEKFPAPKRRVNPNYHEPAVQAGLHKLMLLGARAEGRVFDLDGTRWIGGIEGGLTGLRAQLVALLQQFGVGLTSTLEAASKSLYFTLEGRRGVLEEEANPKKDGEDAKAGE